MGITEDPIQARGEGHFLCIWLFPHADLRPVRLAAHGWTIRPASRSSTPDNNCWWNNWQCTYDIHCRWELFYWLLQ